MSKRLTIIAAGVVAAGALAQDPKTPPSGFAITEVLDQLVTYTDGYKTRVDVRHPTVAHPNRGWPTLMVFHGGGGSRKRSWVAAIATRMARFGYVTIAYDTGGNGETLRLNPPGRRDEVLRIRDIAEMFQQVEGQLGATLDERRLACMGKSGGGKHTLWAASWSGKRLPRTSSAVTHMPIVSAAHSDIQVLDFIPDKVFQGNMIAAEWAAAAYEHFGANDPLVRQMVAHDFAALVDYLESDPGQAFFPLLRQSRVPLVVSYSWDDSKHFINTVANAFPKLAPGVPRRYLLTTGGHGATGNQIEVELRRDFTRRWCDRFLKNVQNGIDREPFAEVAVIPSDLGIYRDPSKPWKHRYAENWPPRTPTQRLYLRSGGRLLEDKANGVEAGPTLRHRVASGYDMIGFMQDKAGAAVLNKIPLVQVSFDTPVVDAPREIFGRPVVELDVLANNRRFQMQVALYDVPPSGPARFITSGVAAKWNVVPTRHRMRIELGETAYILPKGHRLRLALENLNLRRQPGNANFSAAPYFENVDLTLAIDPVFAPRLDLPVVPARASVLPRIQNVTATGGFQANLGVDGEISRAGRPYILYATASGTAPGLNLPPHLPLNPDVWTMTGISLINTPAFQGFLGVLDASGRARARFALPQPFARSVAGKRFSFAGLVFGPGGRIESCGPSELTLR